jgi:hypothetical protein
VPEHVVLAEVGVDEAEAVQHLQGGTEPPLQVGDLSGVEGAVEEHSVEARLGDLGDEIHVEPSSIRSSGARIDGQAATSGRWPISKARRRCSRVSAHDSWPPRARWHQTGRRVSSPSSQP